MEAPALTVTPDLHGHADYVKEPPGIYGQADRPSAAAKGVVPVKQLPVHAVEGRPGVRAAVVTVVWRRGIGGAARQPATVSTDRRTFDVKVNWNTNIDVKNPPITTTLSVLLSLVSPFELLK